MTSTTTESHTSTTKAPRIPTNIPIKLKAAIKFGYDETMKLQLKGENFQSYMEDVITHNQAYWSHPSLGTEVIFEVSNN